jgi:hypothetical protein
MNINIGEIVVLGGDRYVVTSVGKGVYKAVGADNPKLKCTFTNAALGASHPVNIPQRRANVEDENSKRRAAMVKMYSYWD